MVERVPADCTEMWWEAEASEYGRVCEDFVVHVVGYTWYSGCGLLGQCCYTPAVTEKRVDRRVAVGTRGELDAGEIAFK